MSQNVPYAHVLAHNVGERAASPLRCHECSGCWPSRVTELSEGTLRYLLLVAALLSPRRPELLVLNEPEADLDPSLLVPLAELIVRASEGTQVIVVSHAPALVDALGAGPAEGTVQSIRLAKERGDPNRGTRVPRRAGLGVAQALKRTEPPDWSR